LIAFYLGVFRYNGTSFTNISSAINSLRFSRFWDVLEDRKENLWFGSINGAYRYDGKTITDFKSAADQQ
jgi:ligand-binding sensor domain-containing protein